MVRRSRPVTGRAKELSEFEFAALDALGVPAGARRRLVVVPVGRFDLRATKPLEYCWRVTAAERRSVHVAVDEQDLWELGDAWMGSDAWLPLHAVEDIGGVAATLARVVEFELAGGFDEVVVVAGRLGLTRRRYRLLHDRTADAIARTVGRIPNALVALMTVATV